MLERQSISPERQSIVDFLSDCRSNVIDFTRTTIAQKIDTRLRFGFLSHLAFHIGERERNDEYSYVRNLGASVV